MENNEVEIWKDIEGYDGMYQVSNKGRVKSLKFGKEKILRPGKNGNGYLFVYLYKNRKKKMCKVHRLVAMTFLPNPDNLPQVNHKNEDKTDNKVVNLEWCSAKYNINYGTRTQRQAEKLTNYKRSKPVIQYSKSGEFVREWKSIMDVERNLGFNRGNIFHCCTGRYHSAYNFIWTYK